VAEKFIEAESLLSASWRRFGSRIIAGFAISALILLPCVWHRRIEAGDLASHVYKHLAGAIDRQEASAGSVHREAMEQHFV